MKKLAMAALYSTFIVIPAEAAVDFTKAEINIGANSALGIQGEFDFPSKAKNAPDSAQVFLKNYTQSTSYGNLDTWNTTGLGVAGIYDLSAKFQLDDRLYPYAGIGLMYIYKRWSGVGPEKQYNGKKSGLYVTGGITYALTPRISANFNYNNFGTLTVGLSRGL